MRLLFLAIDVYSFVVIASVLLSWVPEARESPAGRWLERATEPALRPLRRAVPLIRGFDISPLLLLVALHFLKRLLVSF